MVPEFLVNECGRCGESRQERVDESHSFALCKSVKADLLAPAIALEATLGRLVLPCFSTVQTVVHVNLGCT